MPVDYSIFSQYQEGSGSSTGIFSEFAIDTMKGLSASPKFLLPKYFYDDAGSEIFTRIMNLPEYYLTPCESEILIENRSAIADALVENGSSFSLIELGSGDGMKTKILLGTLLEKRADFMFVPVDISQKANDELSMSLERELPLLHVEPRTGDFFKLIKTERSEHEMKKVILFMGSNIGNLNDRELIYFLNCLSSFTQKGDKLLIGFDLKKSPEVIVNAYNDSEGLTKQFNINHLVRLNRELKADFDTSMFEQHTEYNPVSGKVLSYLVSLDDQKVNFLELGETFWFKRWETIFMELSRKFEISQIEDLAAENGFKVEHLFTDKRNYFVDSVWIRV